MPPEHDHLGYYAILGIAPTATQAQIKRAFKIRARQLHPDHNAGADATALFQTLSVAYSTLSQPDARAQYDAAAWTNRGDAPQAPSIEPMRCSMCNKISAQPRYAVYHQIYGLLLFGYKDHVSGVFCSACGARASYRASLFTLVLGWWWFPWGPIYSVRALFRNALGGDQPGANNLMVVGFQALYFTSIGRIDVAQEVARDALRFTKRMTVDDWVIHAKIAKPLIVSLSEVVASEGQSYPLPKTWRGWFAILSRPHGGLPNTGRAVCFRDSIANIALCLARLLAPRDSDVVTGEGRRLHKVFDRH